jgi:hypothetical protein
MKNFVEKIVYGGIFAVCFFCGFALLADTVITYEYLPGNTSVNVTTNTSTSEIWTLEDVLFKKRSWEKDNAARIANKDNYLANYNATNVTEAGKLADLNEILSKMDVPK